MVKDGGENWVKNDCYRQFKEAAKEARLPAGTVFFCLRHYYISKALLA